MKPFLSHIYILFVVFNTLSHFVSVLKEKRKLDFKVTQNMVMCP